MSNLNLFSTMRKRILTLAVMAGLMLVSVGIVQAETRKTVHTQEVERSEDESGTTVRVKVVEVTETRYDDGTVDRDVKTHESAIFIPKHKTKE